MKKLLFLLLFNAIGLLAFAQSLSNTVWKVYEPTGEFHAYYKFTPDSLFYSYSGNDFNIISFYTDVGDDFTIIDFMDFDPCYSDLGTYTYSIQNDTLNFVEIEDNCDSRATRLVTNTWVQEITTAVFHLDSDIEIKLYPNPASEYISIEAAAEIHQFSYTIYNQLGQKVLTGALAQEITDINISELPTGSYFIRIGETRFRVFPFIKT